MVEINDSYLETSDHKDYSLYGMGIDYCKTLGAEVYYYVLNTYLQEFTWFPNGELFGGECF